MVIHKFIEVLVQGMSYIWQEKKKSGKLVNSLDRNPIVMKDWNFVLSTMSWNHNLELRYTHLVI